MRWRAPMSGLGIALKWVSNRRPIADIRLSFAMLRLQPAKQTFHTAPKYQTSKWLLSELVSARRIC